MGHAYLDWLETQADRELARQRAQVDTAKLLATLAVGVAATLVATALQVGRAASAWDKVAVGMLGGAFGAVILVVLADRISQVNHLNVVSQSVIEGWSQTQLATKLQALTIAAVDSNEAPVRAVRRLAVIQVLISAASAGAAIVSLV